MNQAYRSQNGASSSTQSGESGARAPAELAPYGNGAAAEQIQPAHLGQGESMGILGEPNGPGAPDPEVFLAMGPYGPMEILPETGLGGFSASYDPECGELLVTLRTGIHFVSPVDEAGEATRDKFQQIADQVKANPALLPHFRWSEEEMSAYETDLEAVVEQTWGGRYDFFLPWKGWEDIRASVRLNIQMLRTDARLDGQHLFVEVVKLPPGSTLESEGLRTNTQPRDAERNDDQTMQLGSNDLQARTDHMSSEILFESGQSEVGPEWKPLLEWLVQVTASDPSFPNSEPFSADVVGHASRDGDAAFNMGLSERRAQSVAGELERLGFQGPIEASGRGEEEATGDAAADRRVSVTVGDGKGQNAAIHEFGHALGLGDEYETRRRPVGAPATHDDLVKRMRDELGQPLPGAIHEPNEGVMSQGDEIRPQHHATFFQALTELTGIEEWRIGGAG